MSTEIFIRSTQSARFEAALREVSVPGGLPRLADIDEAAIGDLLPWVGIVEPNIATRSLIIERAGDAICRALGRDAVGLDYLDIVDPAIQGDAFDSTFVMLTRPCGLWQITPGQLGDGTCFMFEYTGFPVFDDASGAGKIMLLVQPAFAPIERATGVTSVRHATEWCWLEMR
jgi:hypothetical protein